MTGLRDDPADECEVFNLVRVRPVGELAENQADRGRLDIGAQFMRARQREFVQSTPRSMQQTAVAFVGEGSRKALSALAAVAR